MVGIFYLEEQLRSGIYCTWRQEPIQIKGYKAPICTGTNFIILEEIPSEEHGIYIKGYNEVYNLEDIKYDNDFYCNYREPFVYFHDSQMGKTITINEYFGLGNTRIDATRIVTKTDGRGNILQTLQEWIDAYPHLLLAIDQAIECYTRIESDIVVVEELVDKVKAIQNPTFTINTDDWVTSIKNGNVCYYYDITHNLDSFSVIPCIVNLSTNMVMSPTAEILSKNSMRIYSLEKYNAKVILNTSYYHGTDELNSEIIQEVEDGRCGEVSLGTKISKIDDNINDLYENLDSQGARNYLNKTNFNMYVTSNIKETWSGSHSSTISLIESDDNVSTMPIGVTKCLKNVSAGTTALTTQTVKLEPSTKYTISMWVYVPSSNSSGSYPSLKVYYNYNGWKALGTKTIIKTNNTDKWIKVQYTFKTHAAYTSTVLGFGLFSASANDISYSCQWMLEKGDSCHDYTPNTLEIQNDVNTLNNRITTTKTELQNLITTSIDNYKKNVEYAVGKPYISFTDSRNPKTILGFGTWQKLEGVTIFGASNSDSDFAIGKTGGSKSHTMTINEMPAHNHGQIITNGIGGNISGRADYVEDGSELNAYPQGCNTDSTGGGQAFSILPPYKTAYIWVRTA